ncbi:MAG: MCT family MFS transporter [Actinomycetota bacterium]
MQRRIDGGFAWVSVASAFVAHVVGFGMIYSFTVFFPPILQEFEQGRGSTAWTVSIAAALMLGAGSVAGRAADRFGPGKLLATGAVLISTGLFASSVAGALWQVQLAYGLILGTGVACAYVPSVATVSGWFERRRGLALGLAVSGSGVGAIIFAPLSQALISDMGWRSAMRVLAAVSLVTVMAAAAFLKPRLAIAGKATEGLRLRGNRAFMLLFASGCIASYGYWVPFVHIVPFAEDRGLSSAAAAGLVPLMGLANTSGRIVMGAMADRLGRHRMMRFSIAALAVALVAWIGADSFLELAMFGIVYGVFAGSFIALLPALAGDYFGMERLAGVTGALFSGAAVGTLFGAPVSGALFDATGSYTVAIVLAAVSMAIGAAILFALPPPPARIPAR